MKTKEGVGRVFTRPVLFRLCALLVGAAVIVSSVSLIGVSGSSTGSRDDVIDVAVTHITAPWNGTGMYYMKPGTIQISCIIENLGTVYESGLVCTANITKSGNTCYHWEIRDLVLSPGEEESLVFPNATFYTLGWYNLTISMPCWEDSNASNNAKTLSIDVTYAPDGTTYDLDPPEPNGDNGWYITPVSIVFYGFDNGPVYYSINEGNWSVYTQLIVLSASGCYQIEYYGYDINGNIEPTRSFSLKIDVDSPSIVVSKQVFLNRIKYTATCSDPTSNVSRVEWYMGGFLQYTDTDPSDGWIWVLHPIPQGVNITPSARAYDGAGNMAILENYSISTQEYKAHGYRYHPLQEEIHLLFQKLPRAERLLDELNGLRR